MSPQGTQAIGTGTTADLAFYLYDRDDRIADRLNKKIERLNRRVRHLEHRGRSR